MAFTRTVSVVAPVDALLFKGDASPATRAVMSAVLVLQGTPSLDRLRASFDRAARAVPRLRSRVTRSALMVGQMHWVLDDDFDVRQHVREVGAPGDRSLQAVLGMASSSATTAFDPARPLWDALLVTGLVDETAVVVIRAHHALADGVRVIEMMAHLVDLEPDANDAPLPPLPPRRSRAARVVDEVVTGVGHSALTRQRRANAAARTLLHSSLAPISAAARVGAYATSVGRNFGAEGSGASPLLAKRGRDRCFKVLDLSLSEIRACARGHGVTVNDVYLVGVAGGMVAYHEACGAQVDDVPMSMPIDVSHAGEAARERPTAQ